MDEQRLPGIHRPCHSKTLHTVAPPTLLVSMHRRSARHGTQLWGMPPLPPPPPPLPPRPPPHPATQNRFRRRPSRLDPSCNSAEGCLISHQTSKLCTCARQPHCALLALRSDAHASRSSAPICPNPPALVQLAPQGPCAHRMRLKDALPVQQWYTASEARQGGDFIAQQNYNCSKHQKGRGSPRLSSSASSCLRSPRR